MGGQRKPEQGAVTGQSQSQSGPYEGSKKYIDDVLRRARQQYKQGGGFGPNVQNALDYFSGAASGQYGVGSEGFNRALDAAKNKIIPGVESRFAQGGRLHSGLARTSEAGAIGDAYAGLYDAERNRQQQAAGALGQLGMQTSPQAALQNYINAVYGVPGQSSSSQTGYGQQYFKGSPWSGAAGGALAGSSFGPWGALAGGALGGLGSLF